MDGGDVLATGFVALDVIWEQTLGLIRLSAGGSCGNVVATLAAVGFHARLAARLGRDAEAGFVRADLGAAGVGLADVRGDAAVSTPVVIHQILPNAADHRFLLSDPASGARFPRYSGLEMSDLARLMSAPAPRVLYFDRLTPAIAALARWTKERGGLTFFEPSDIAPDIDMAEVEPWVDILKVSTQRASEFEGRIGFSSPIQILTDGRRGLDVFMGGHEDREHRHLDAVPAVRLVDSAGAGDAVSSAIIATILENWTGELPTPDLLAFGLRRGQEFAALNCGFAGARGSLEQLGAGEIANLLQLGAGSGMRRVSDGFSEAGVVASRRPSARGLERRYAAALSA